MLCKVWFYTHNHKYTKHTNIFTIPTTMNWKTNFIAASSTGTTKQWKLCKASAKNSNEKFLHSEVNITIGIYYSARSRWTKQHYVVNIFASICDLMVIFIVLVVKYVSLFNVLNNYFGKDAENWWAHGEEFARCSESTNIL